MFGAGSRPGASNSTSCQPARRFRRRRWRSASRAPEGDQRLPTCVPVVVRALVEADALDVAAGVAAELHAELHRARDRPTSAAAGIRGRGTTGCRARAAAGDDGDRDAGAGRFAVAAVVDGAGADRRRTGCAGRPVVTSRAAVPCASATSCRRRPTPRRRPPMPPPCRTAVPVIVMRIAAADGRAGRPAT